MHNHHLHFCQQKEHHDFIQFNHKMKYNQTGRELFQSNPSISTSDWSTSFSYLKIYLSRVTSAELKAASTRETIFKLASCMFSEKKPPHLAISTKNWISRISCSRLQNNFIRETSQGKRKRLPIKYVYY